MDDEDIPLFLWSEDWSKLWVLLRFRFLVAGAPLSRPLGGFQPFWKFMRRVNARGVSSSFFNTRDFFRTWRDDPIGFDFLASFALLVLRTGSGWAMVVGGRSYLSRDNSALESEYSKSGTKAGHTLDHFCFCLFCVCEAY